jgi:hypothetical protein
VIFDILSVSVFLSRLECEVIITEAELTLSWCGWSCEDWKFPFLIFFTYFYFNSCYYGIRFSASWSLIVIEGRLDVDGFSFSFFLYISLGSTIVFISKMGSVGFTATPASYLNGLSGGFPLTSLYVVLFGSFKEPLNQNISLLPWEGGDTFFGCKFFKFDWPPSFNFFRDFILLWIGL